MKTSPHKHVQKYLAPGMVVAMLSCSGRGAFIFRLDEDGNVKFTESLHNCRDQSFIFSNGTDHQHWFQGDMRSYVFATVETMHAGTPKPSDLKRWKKLAHKRLGIK